MTEITQELNENFEHLQGIFYQILEFNNRMHSEAFTDIYFGVKKCGAMFK